MSSNDFHQQLNMEEQVRPPPGQPPGTASSLGGQQQQSSVLTGSLASLSITISAADEFDFTFLSK